MLHHWRLEEIAPQRDGVHLHRPPKLVRPRDELRVDRAPLDHARVPSQAGWPRVRSPVVDKVDPGLSEIARVVVGSEQGLDGGWPELTVGAALEVHGQVSLVEWWYLYGVSMYLDAWHRARHAIAIPMERVVVVWSN